MNALKLMWFAFVVGLMMPQALIVFFYSWWLTQQLTEVFWTRWSGS
jgi:hypothetical protein